MNIFDSKLRMDNQHGRKTNRFPEGCIAHRHEPLQSTLQDVRPVE